MRSSARSDPLEMYFGGESRRFNPEAALEDFLGPHLDAERSIYAHDPVRVYLREIGAVRLLSIKGELDVARRMERGKQRIQKAISRSALVQLCVFDIAEELEKGAELIDNLVDLEAGALENPHQRSVVKQIFTDVIVLYKQQQRIRRKLKATAFDDKRMRRRLCSKLNRSKVEISQAIRKIPFSPAKWTQFTKEIERAVEEQTHQQEVAQDRDRRAGVDVWNGAREAKKAVRELEATVPRADLEHTLKMITHGEQEAERAKKELVAANLRLVVSIAKKYVRHRLHLLDLIQEGNLGLMCAADRFQYRLGYKFSTYATWWVRQAITRAIADKLRTIRIPVHVNERVNKLLRASRELEKELCRTPTDEEIGQRMHIPVQRVQMLKRAGEDAVSLEALIGFDGQSSLGELIEDLVVSPANAANANKIAKEIGWRLKTLSMREEKIMRMRFGIGYKRAYTLDEVGQEFNVTRERIRQIEARALRRLRNPAQDRNLRALFNESAPPVFHTLSAGTRALDMQQNFVSFDGAASDGIDR